MTGKDKIIDAFSKCIRTDDDGFFAADCEHCPNKSDERKAKGLVFCEGFEDLSVDVPWQLAHDILDIAIQAMKEKDLVRCKNCRSNHECSIQFKFAVADNEENWFCANFHPSDKAMEDAFDKTNEAVKLNG